MQRIAILASLSLLLMLPMARADAVLSAGSGSGLSFAIPVSIAGVSDLYDFQFDVAFNPAVMQLESVTEGSFLDSLGLTFFLPGFIDNTAGTATFIADTLVGPIPGASGSGPLVNLDFQAVGQGTSALTLANVILQDSHGDDISFSSVPGTLVSPIPEPGYPWVTAGLLLCLAAIRRHRRAQR